MRVAKLMKEDWPIVLPRVTSWCYSKNFGLILVLKSFITKVLGYKDYLKQKN